LVVHGLPAIRTPIEIPWPIFAIGFGLAELKVVEVHFRRESHAFSLSEFPAIIGLFFLPPQIYLLSLLAGTGIALIFLSYQHPVDRAVLDLAPRHSVRDPVPGLRRIRVRAREARATGAGVPIEQDPSALSGARRGTARPSRPREDDVPSRAR